SSWRGAMIFYLCTERNAETMAPWVATWGEALANRVVTMHYETLSQYRSLPQGTYIFADLEFLTEAQKRLAEVLWDQLAAAGEKVRLLNHPRRSAMRYELLKTLRERGILAYDVHRATELP